MDKRTFLKIAGVAGAGMMLSPLAGCLTNESDSPEMEGNQGKFGPDTFNLPDLGYGWDALAPAIDAATMEIHHGKHHAGYVNKLNAALEGRVKMGEGSLPSLLTEVKPDDEALRNNGGGHFNHTLYWEVMRPGGPKTPEGELMTMIDGDLGGMERFAGAFADAGAARFGSGWAWLILTPQGHLKVTSTPNQDNPLMAHCVEQTGTPLLGMDVWEHAYYLNYQNRRKDYIQAFLGLVNWESVSNRLHQS